MPLHQAMNLELEIRIPEGWVKDASVKTHSGDIRIENIRFTILTLDASSGDIELSSVETGRLKAECASGDIDAVFLDTENAELAAQSGNIELEDVTGDVSARTASGDVTVRYAKFSNDVSLYCASGDVLLLLPEGAEFVLNARASSGDITCDFPLLVREMKRNKRSLEGTAGGGKNLVEIETASGDITVRPR
ncbi:MAG: DUF4097 family beta strand repeat protein [Spirochaetes bacterium]|nr:DUF4097 family beta strand repeat protein [Spirochaetota bacterium]